MLWGKDSFRIVSILFSSTTVVLIDILHLVGLKLNKEILATMGLKQEIGQLINVVNTETGVEEAIKKREIALIANLLESSQKYIGIVVKQGLLLQVHEGTSDRDILEELASLDRSRSRIHDSLIHQIAITNRL